jgi:hypothetical protein
MTTDDFRRISLSMPGAEELNGLGYPNFRAGRRSFATLEDSVAVLRLTRDQQAAFMAKAPEVFAPVSSGWGRLGSTIVQLEAADEAMLRDALATAWRNVTNIGADAVNIADAFQVADAVCVANGADDLTDIVAKADVEKLDVTNVAADVANGPADVPNLPAIKPADVDNVEPPDALQSVIDRLQAYWGPGPAT